MDSAWYSKVHSDGWGSSCLRGGRGQGRAADMKVSAAVTHEEEHSGSTPVPGFTRVYLYC